MPDILRFEALVCRRRSALIIIRFFMKNIGAINHSTVGNKIRAAFVLLVALSLLLTAWQSDDAYHAYTMARHLVEGNGFVYTIGERVNASTCPLWTLLCAAIYAVCGNMYAGTLALCILCSTAAMTIIFRACRSWSELVLCTVLFVTGPCLIFGTSGLENPLMFLLSGILCSLLLSSENDTGKGKLFAIALTMALLAWTRMDIALMFAPACVLVYLCRRHESVSFFSSVVIALCGLSPFIIWCLFSTWYYGFPFPNTAYSKLFTGLPASYYFSSGLSYLFWSWVCYGSIPVSIALATFLYCKKTTGNAVVLSLLCGILLYVLYIVDVGGDFMLGRHFSVVLYVCMCIIVHLLRDSENQSYPLCGVSLLALLWTTLTMFISLLFFLPESGGRMASSIRARMGFDGTYNVLNSRHYGTEIAVWGAGFSSLLRSDRIQRGMLTDVFSFRLYAGDDVYATLNAAPKAACLGSAAGNLVYQYNSKTHLIDGYGLGDALIARLPSRDEKPRIGHIIRNVPDGYLETLISGENRIVDEKLHEYYDHLKNVISGDLFSISRMGDIYDLNIGRYNYLLR